MFVERAGFAGAIWQIVIRFLVRFDRARFEEKNIFIEHASVAGGLDVTARRAREPQVIVGKMRAHATTDWRMPPVLNVAFAKLVRGGAENLLAQQFRARVDQRHRILQLVAKTERAAGLIKSRARPQAAGNRLINCLLYTSRCV